MRKLPAPALVPCLALLLPVLGGCPTPEPDCVPSEAAFAQNVKPIIDAVCSECHGAVPEFGAAFSLLEYGPLVEGPEGQRIVDQMAAQLAANTMPPTRAESLNRLPRASCPPCPKTLRRIVWAWPSG